MISCSCNRSISKLLWRIEPLKDIEEIVHATKSHYLLFLEIHYALGVLTPPGKFGADIVIGDAQPFGIPTHLVDRTVVTLQ